MLPRYCEDTGPDSRVHGDLALLRCYRSNGGLKHAVYVLAMTPLVLGLERFETFLSLVRLVLAVRVQGVLCVA